MLSGERVANTQTAQKTTNADTNKRKISFERFRLERLGLCVGEGDKDSPGRSVSVRYPQAGHREASSGRLVPQLVQNTISLSFLITAWL